MRKCGLPVLLFLVGSLVMAPGAWAQRKVFNDDRPETKALELWRMTQGVRTRYHTVYHDSDPFNYNGRYLLYVIGEEEDRTDGKAGQTFAVYDLMQDREIWRSPLPARWPIWAHRGNRIFWGDGTKGRRQNVWQVEIPEGRVTRICDDAMSGVTGVTPDDEWLYYTLRKVWRVRTRPGSRSELAWEHPETGNVSSSLVCHSPSRPVYQVRQNIASLSGRVMRWDRDHPARMLVGDDGRMLGPALASLEQAHGSWRGDGEFLIAGDGLLRGRAWNQAYPVPLLAHSNTPAHDPSSCGRSGQWTCTTDGINDCLKRFDWRTTDTTLIAYSCSIIHQRDGDNRDLSGPYDSDAFGSPDGTKICFSTNYQLDRFPATRVAASSRDAVEVLSTRGFPDRGLLSVHVGILSYTGRTATSFTGIRPKALGSRFTVIPEGASVSNFAGRSDAAAADPLNAQYATDVYIAVARLPDRPTLAAQPRHILLYPGRNHWETRGYELLVDGKPLRREPWDGRQPLDLPAAGKLEAKAVEWSGLASRPSAPIALDGRARTLRCASERPAALDEPRRECLAPDARGAMHPLPAGRRVEELPEVVVRVSSPDGELLAEETLQRGRLVRRAELTPDGRPTLVQEYQDGRVVKRTIRDPMGRLCRVESLDARGLLTGLEEYSRGRLSARTEYAEGEPTFRTVHTRAGKVIRFENRQGRWEKCGP